MGQCKQCGKYLTPAETGLPCPDCGSSDRVIASFDLGSSIEVAEAAEALARKHYEIEAGLTQNAIKLSRIGRKLLLQ